MRMLGVIAIAAMLFSGCAQFQRSEVIDTDKLGGFASGTFHEESSGSVGNFGLIGGVGGAGVSGGGGGIGALSVTTGPPKSGAYDFARAIAMINYSKKLKSIRYDECGGVIEYEFDQKPLSSAKTSSHEYGSPQKLPSSFGYQPIK
ncbi:MAG: hypothetical protein P8168_14580 [Deltaproteobacteria bacterium]|jgi:hypothetical protein